MTPRIREVLEEERTSARRSSCSARNQARSLRASTRLAATLPRRRVAGGTQARIDMARPPARVRVVSGGLWGRDPRRKGSRTSQRHPNYRTLHEGPRGATEGSYGQDGVTVRLARTRAGAARPAPSHPLFPLATLVTSHVAGKRVLYGLRCSRKRCSKGAHRGRRRASSTHFWQCPEKQKAANPVRNAAYLANLLVGASGFEPPTPRSRTECSTRLSHAPTQA